MSGTSGNSTTSKSFKATSQVNPFYTTKTDKKGNTVTNFQNGTAQKTVYDITNNNISRLLDNYLNPSLDGVANQAKLAAFDKTQANSLQNNILNPLTQNNMIRSSQATNMYNNLQQQRADYANQLLANEANTKDMIEMLANLYTQAYTGASGEEQTSINASLGGGTTKTKSNAKS